MLPRFDKCRGILRAVPALVGCRKGQRVGEARRRMHKRSTDIFRMLSLVIDLSILFGGPVTRGPNNRTAHNENQSVGADPALAARIDSS